MNRKHLGAIIVLLLIIVMFQLTMSIRKRLTKVENELLEAQAAANASATLLLGERMGLTGMQENSADMLEFLNLWSQPMNTFDTPESAELAIAARVKQAELLTLSQRFEVTKNDNESLPRIVRAYLTFEDDYVKTLNWIGSIESEFPSSRITALRILRGEGGDDVRVTLTLDLPLPNERIVAQP